MREVTIYKRWQFDAAHVLPFHSGKCQNPHGHTYTIEVGVTGVPNPVDGRSDGGMVVDFYVLSEIWKQVEPQLDHRDLEVTLVAPGYVEATTCELIAEWLLKHFAVSLAHYDSDFHVSYVEVKETASSGARARYVGSKTP